MPKAIKKVTKAPVSSKKAPAMKAKKVAKETTPVEAPYEPPVRYCELCEAGLPCPYVDHPNRVAPPVVPVEEPKVWQGPRDAQDL